jgi:sterol desaturase/sphingolipid hydroxylase (fatty acid hydroxylase superfamily)
MIEGLLVADLMTHEPLIRLAGFAGVIAAMALWEYWAPKRPLAVGRPSRWPGNLGVLAVDVVLVRILFPTAAVGVALVCEARGWGLFNVVPVPFVAATLASVVLLDLAIYLQHVLFHAVPVLWRLHRMHHADLDIDVTTGVRFHPVEILLSLLIKFGVIALLGAPALAVLIFEVLLNATSMFNHGNVRMPAAVDRIVRLLVVTPDMHRVHHSIARAETNSNFGFNFPWWDRLFGTYRAQPAAGHEGMTIGLEVFRDPAELRLDRMLLQPLRERRDGYPILRSSK